MLTYLFTHTFQLDSYKIFVKSCRSDLERIISRKSHTGPGLAKLLEKLKSHRVSKGGGSSTDVSDGVFDEDGDDDVSQLRTELKKCREDLLNDEKIFADQQLDFEQVTID